MPPHSKELFQEGAAIKSEKLVSEGSFNAALMEKLLYHDPAKYPGCSGTRCLADNINDLKAQIAANQEGINLIRVLIEEYGEETVLFYSVRDLLKDVSNRFEGRELSTTDFWMTGAQLI